jgi:hypothetical protein
MRIGTYRLVVVASLMCSFLVGLHVPALHEMLEHGAAPRPAVLVATLLLVAGTLAGGWTLLVRAPVRRA